MGLGRGWDQQLALLPGSGARRSRISHVLVDGQLRCCCWYLPSGRGGAGRSHCVTMYREVPRAERTECLGNMTLETQDIYLRMDHHRRRSGYRLGRIIARQQLLKRIAAGMERYGFIRVLLSFTGVKVTVFVGV